jgi:phage shock protein A
MAGSKNVQRQLDEVKSRAEYWKERAVVAVNKARDDLAREALIERRRHTEKADALDRELMEHTALVDQYHEEIRQLEEKLRYAKEKERILVQRQVLAESRIRAQEELRRLDSSDAVFRFEELESRIERIEAEADLINYGKPSTSLEEEFQALTVDEDIEEELRRIKTSGAT